jgi:N-hydroxyarylamine O-acetyltransferase
VPKVSDNSADELDLAAYLSRIQHDGPVSADVETLRALHLAHATHIPFENLDVQLGVPIALDIASLQRKLVQNRRGGYCFEQNTLFLHALRRVGIEALPCEARVRSGSEGKVLPRTHMVLVVAAGGADWLCDVGFGADGLLLPLQIDGDEHLEFGRHVRTVLEGNELVLQCRWDQPWEDLYAFVPEPRHPVDFEVGNWYTSTWPESVFVKTLTVQRNGPEERHLLRQLTFTVRRGPRLDTREIPRRELVALLRDVFGLDLPASSRFRALDP